MSASLEDLNADLFESDDPELEAEVMTLRKEIRFQKAQADHWYGKYMTLRKRVELSLEMDNNTREAKLEKIWQEGEADE